MITSLLQCFTPTCRVIKFPNKELIFPIFKNGCTSLYNYANANKLDVLKNKDLLKEKKVKIFLRDPLERFVSGVNTVIEQKKIKNVNSFIKKIEELKYTDRHFLPQILWLFHLSKYFKGDVELISVKELYKLIPNRDNPLGVKKLTEQRKQTILQIENGFYINSDIKLIKTYLGQTLKLTKITREFKNVLSSS